MKRIIKVCILVKSTLYNKEFFELFGMAGVNIQEHDFRNMMEFLKFIHDTKKIDQELEILLEF